jgi:DNA-damage-inducible protein D
MKTEEIKQLFKDFESAAYEIDGVECWSARDMQILLGYSKWENFEKVIQKAKDACENAGETVLYHFPDVRKTIPMPKGAEKEIIDIALTRYACYLLAQNGDSRKPENLPRAEDIKKIQRKLDSDEKSVLKEVKKKKKKD